MDGVFGVNVNGVTELASPDEARKRDKQVVPEGARSEE